MAEPRHGYQRRNTLRYKAYDYTKPGAYFITICTHWGRPSFGQIIDQTMVLNPLGQIVAAKWEAFGQRHATSIRLDTYVVMPNHLHLLFWILDKTASAPGNQPVKQRQFGDAIAGSVSTLMGSYKSSVTQQAQHDGLIPSPPLWQDNFWDRIVRNDQELERIRSYIQSNPMRWLEDQLHPDAPPNQFNVTWHPATR